jgi:transposase
MDLTDQQLTVIEPLFEAKRRPDGRPWRDARAVLNGLLLGLVHRRAVA